MIRIVHRDQHCQRGVQKRPWGFTVLIMFVERKAI